jgi:prolyl oligopeptidase
MNLKQPIARVTPVSDTYFGVTITDPYRWMEDSAQEEFQTWLTAQNDYTRAWLDTQPGRAELVQQILELRQTGPRLFDVKVAGDRMFAIRLEPGQLVARRLPDGPEEVLYDPHQGATKAQPLAWYVPSPNGRQVLFNVLVEQDTYRVLDCMTGTIRDHGITGAGYDDGSGRGQPYWLADSSGFFYNKNNSMWLHRLGDTPDQDRVIWGPETMPGTIVPGDAAFVVTVPSSRWMLGLIFHGDRHEFSVYHAPLTTLADPDWRKVAGIEDGVVGYVLRGTRLASLATKPTLWQTLSRVPSTWSSSSTPHQERLRPMVLAPEATQPAVRLCAGRICGRP